MTRLLIVYVFPSNSSTFIFCILFHSIYCDFTFSSSRFAPDIVVGVITTDGQVCPSWILHLVFPSTWCFTPLVHFFSESQGFSSFIRHSLNRIRDSSCRPVECKMSREGILEGKPSTLTLVGLPNPNCTVTLYYSRLPVNSRCFGGTSVTRHRLLD